MIALLSKAEIERQISGESSELSTGSNDSYIENVVALSTKLGSPKTGEEAEREASLCNQRAKRAKSARDRKHAQRMAELEREHSISLEALQLTSR